MINNVKIFEGNNVEIFELNGKVLFNTKDVCKCLDIVNYRDAIRNFNDKQKVKVKNSDMVNTHIRKLNNAGENFITESGVKRLITRSNSTKKEALLKAFGFNEVVVLNRFETSFGQALIETLKPMNIEVEAQKPVFSGKYRIDFYLPQYNLAIEYDEEHHQSQTEEDFKRQLEIEKELNYKFIRLDYKNNDNFNVGIVLNEIMANYLIAS